jgi:Flp pilus assembly protein TadD
VDTLGWVHYRRGAYADAEKALAQAVERDPRNASYQYHLGMTYYRLGKRTDAASALRRAAQLDPMLASREKLPELLKELGG